MIFEHKLDRVIDDCKAWECYIDPTTWTKWDPSLKKVDMDGCVEIHKTGIKYLKHARHPLPFEIVEIEDHKRMVLMYQRGTMKIFQSYCIEDHHLLWRVRIEGGNETQVDIMMKKITQPIPMVMNRLSMMIAPIMVNRQEALEMFFKEWQPPRDIENVTIMQSLRRTLAKNLYSQVTLPLYRVSMMDGIAVRSKDFENGIPDTSSWQEGKEYVRADTGDDFPDEYDAVIMIEKVRMNAEGSLSFVDLKAVKKGDFTNEAGSIVQKGDLLLPKGQLIRPTDLSVIAMGNYTEVPVIKKPCVAIIPTGSELVVAGSNIKRGENIDSNSYMLQGQLQELGADVIVFPIIKDQRDKLLEVLQSALQQADLVIINGGSSKGGEDYNIQLLKENGKVICHHVSAVPGRPIALTLFDQKPVINIPGPSLAAYFATEWCMRAILDYWFGRKKRMKHVVQGVLKQPLDNGGPVEILHRVQVEENEDGHYDIYPLDIKDGQVKVMSSQGQYVSSFFEEAHEIGELLEIEIID